jgi:galactokinase
VDPEKLQRACAERFGGCPAVVVRSPGRVNLIGEHTDYNQGLVLPMAIDRAIWIAARPRLDRRVVVWSLDFETPAEFDFDALESAHGGRSRTARRDPAQALRRGWTDYVAGVAWSLIGAGFELSGFEAVVGSEVPRDAGLSSSAALEMAIARVFAELSGWPWDPAVMAQIARRAENEWVGVECGVMDQLAVGCGVRDHALLIDCRSLIIEPVPLPPDVAVIVLDTGVRRRLADTEYNLRRRECDAAARCLGVDTLRDLDPARLARMQGRLPGCFYGRALHVLTENGRVLHAARALRAGDPSVCGRFMLASHRSLTVDFAVSCPELDAMVRCATRQPGCYGARMTGAGFGGCAVALAETGAAECCRAGAIAAYEAETGRAARGWICRAECGTSAEVHSH